MTPQRAFGWSWTYPWIYGWSSDTRQQDLLDKLPRSGFHTSILRLGIRIESQGEYT